MTLVHPTSDRRIGYGGDYNPEQWPREVWAEDARLMQEAGVTFVTLGVFSWALLEPERGARDFGWLDEVMDLMHAHGIAVDLATATASPPAWLGTEHPEIFPVDVDGRRLVHGSRQAWCPSSPVYREASLALVHDLAARYADHPALVLWHVSNELGCHNALCYCEVSAASFRRWLQRRYGDLDALNAAWGTAFWSQHYGDWEEILTPAASTAIPNPTQQLDFGRFSSDELLGQHVAERDAIRRHSDLPVTTNFMVTDHVDSMDYWRWAPEQDVVSQDHYLDGRLEEPLPELSFCADWTRSLAGGAPWILMEHSTSAVNWQPRNYPKAPGAMRRNSLQHVARGADAVGFFQWRASQAGAEKYHSAMLPHAGTDSRVWREVVELGDLLHRIAEVEGTRTVADVAMVLDWDSRWAVERDSLPTTDMVYLDRARALHRTLTDAGLTVAMVPPGAGLGGYPLVLAPTLHVLTDDAAAALAAYVEGGGHLLVTYFSGVVDEHDHVRLGGYPGALRDLLGVRVEEFTPLRHGREVGLVGADGAALPGSADTWTEDLAVTGAEVVATYADGPHAGVPALTRREHGAGVAWYLATRTDPEATAHVVRRLLADAGVATLDPPPGVEVVRRAGEGRHYTFVLNHSDVAVSLPLTGTDLVSGDGVDGTLALDPGDVAVVRAD